MKFNKEKYKKIDMMILQNAIKYIKNKFGKLLEKNLNLTRVSAPIIIDASSGLQDDLSGTERKVEFDLLQDGSVVQIVQSLAKWKRFALAKYNFKENCGLYTDMLALRRDDIMDQTHSVYVDQYDWEKIIRNDERNIDFLKKIVSKIAYSIYCVSKKVNKKFKLNMPKLEKNVYFVSSQELLDMYPNKTPKEREYEIVKQKKCVFITKIGGKLSNNLVHDVRATDYDDWELNGDLFYYHEVLDMALEISSMGIRVNAESLLKQLDVKNEIYKKDLPYHKLVLSDSLPLTIGGGIGQSRLCMLILNRAHIGEVQSSFWPKSIIEECKQNGIDLL